MNATESICTGRSPFTSVGLRIVQMQFEFKWQSQKADNRFYPPLKPCGVHLVTMKREMLNSCELEMATLVGTTITHR